MSGWISVKDRLPEPGLPVLCSGLDYGEGPTRHMVVAECVDGCFVDIESETGDSRAYDHITHWQPLPPPPGAEDEADVQAAINKAECV